MAKKRTGSSKLNSINRQIAKEKLRIRVETKAAQLAALKKKKGHNRTTPAKRKPARRKRRR